LNGIGVFQQILNKFDFFFCESVIVVTAVTMNNSIYNNTLDDWVGLFVDLGNCY